MISTQERPELNAYFVNGRGSSGKDTQVDLLVAADLRIRKYSTGDIFRGALTPDGPYGRFFPRFEPHIPVMKAGGFVPDDVTLSVVRELLDEDIASGVNRIFFTGFPRTEPQLDAVDNFFELLGQQGYKVNTQHIYFAVSEMTSRARANGRYTAAMKLREQGIPAEIRDDDRPEVVERRLTTFKDKTYPMLGKLNEQGRLITVSAEAPIKEVAEDLQQALRGSERFRRVPLYI